MGTETDNVSLNANGSRYKYKRSHFNISLANISWLIVAVAQANVS